MPLKILGIGTSIPEHAIDQAGAAELARSFCRQPNGSRDVLTALYRRCGVETRHSVVLDQRKNGSAVQQSF